MNNATPTIRFMTQSELDFYKHKDENGHAIRSNKPTAGGRPLAMPNTGKHAHKAEWHDAVRRSDFAFFN